MAFSWPCAQKSILVDLRGKICFCRSHFLSQWRNNFRKSFRIRGHVLGMSVWSWTHHLLLSGNSPALLDLSIVTSSVVGMFREICGAGYGNSDWTTIISILTPKFKGKNSYEKISWVSWDYLWPLLQIITLEFTYLEVNKNFPEPSKVYEKTAPALELWKSSSLLHMKYLILAHP